jgi:hypothetical protein
MLRVHPRGYRSRFPGRLSTTISCGNPQADTIIKALLRAHPGLQNNLVNISEGSLAQYARTDIEKVRKVLEAAHTAGVLYYQPQRDKPQIVFTRERVSAENLELDVKKFRFRRERAEERVRQAIQAMPRSAAAAVSCCWRISGSRTVNPAVFVTFVRGATNGKRTPMNSSVTPEK